MDILGLKDQVFSRQKTLAKIYSENRDLNLKDYANRWPVNINGPGSDYGDFLSSVEKLAVSHYGIEIAGKVTEQLSSSTLVSTIDHHGIFNHPFFLNSNLIYSLRTDLDFLICFSTAGVSLNNSSWPGSLSVTGQNGEMRRFSFFPDRIKTQAVLATQSFSSGDASRVMGQIQKADFLSGDKKQKLAGLVDEIFQNPELIKLSDFYRQAAVASRLLWSKAFPKAPQLLYLPIEELVTALLTKKIADNDSHILKRLFFSRDGWEMIEKYFQNSPGAFTDIYKGSFLFWGINNNRHRIHLIKQNEILVDHEFSLPLNAESMANALSVGRIYPTNLVCLLTMLYYGITCLGGFNQVNWLTDMKEKFVNLLNEWGEKDIAFRIATIPTDGFAEGNLAFGIDALGRLYKPTALDLFFQNEELAFEKYHRLAAQVTLGESIDTQFPEIYKVITPAHERKEAILEVTEAEIIKHSGLDDKIRRVLL